jgi:hypothetical protein
MFGFGTIGLIIYIYTIFDVVRSKFFNSSDRLVWLLIVILVPLVGTIFWFLIGRNKRI